MDQYIAIALVRNQGGNQAAFHKQDAAAALSKSEDGFTSAEEISCGLIRSGWPTIWCQSPPSQVRDIQKSFLPSLDPPKAFSFTTRGFQRLSQPQPAHARVFADAEAVGQGADEGVSKPGDTSC